MIQVQPQFIRWSDWMALSSREGLLFEPLEFFMPPVNGDAERFRALRGVYADCGRVTSLHGAFIDVNPASGDPDISELSRRRCHESCTLAKALGAKQVVFHDSAHPFLRGPYLDIWAGKCADFYSELADTYGLGIRVENSQSVDCAPLLKLMRCIQGSDVAVCLDLGHVHYALEPMEKWFDQLGEYIGYMHLSDNMGHFDDHLPVGEGTIDWEKADALWRQLNRNVPMTLEVGGIEGVEASLAYIRKNHFFGI